jgi:hypothetical protein
MAKVITSARWGRRKPRVTDSGPSVKTSYVGLCTLNGTCLGLNHYAGLPLRCDIAGTHNRDNHLLALSWNIELLFRIVS